jgi:SAM-dependent methyltransferase
MNIERIARHVRNPKALPSLVWKNILFPFTPQGKEMRYDRRLSIDTSGFVDPDKLGVAEGEGRAYMGTPPAIAAFLIGKIAQYARDSTFVDIGSGKGRVLLVASRFAFRRVVGFEHSAQMNEIAAANVRQFAKHYPRMAPVEIVSGDATRLPLPAGPLVIFLFNPFGAALMRDFAASIKTSYEHSPRKIIVIYYNAIFAEEFVKLGIFSIQEVVATPSDPTDRYTALRLPTMIFETLELVNRPVERLGENPAAF